ncbi:MAG: fimbria/pilus periplasmic chaperone [Polyangiaceae bacterium]
MSRSWGALLLASWCAFVRPAHASLVSINPTRVELSVAKPTDSLTLNNGGTEPSRFQVTAHAWAQATDGSMQLAPTRDLVFFPSLFELKGGESRRIRIAAASPNDGSINEKAYRIFVEELPPATPDQSGKIRVLTRLGVPVFLQPSVPRPQPIVGARVEGGHLLAWLENRGNAHLLARSMRVVGRSRNGDVVLQRDLPTWYVLAGGRREYDLPVTRELCARISEVWLTAKTDEDVVTTSQAVLRGPCVDP